MPLVQGKCTNCGGVLTVDNNLEAAICPYCNTPYIVEKAINNITINGTTNIQNANVIIESGTPSVSNLLARALEFERAGDYNKAVKYYNRVLDLDYTNQQARNGIAFINQRSQASQNAQEQFLMKLPCSCKGGFIPCELLLSNQKLYCVTKSKTVDYRLEDIEEADSKHASFILKVKGEKRKYFL